MLPAKYQSNQPGGSAEEVVWIVFIIYGHGGYLEFRIMTFLAIFRSPNPWRLHMKFGYIWPSGFRGEVVWKCWRTTDGRGDFPSYKLPAAFGSGELKHCFHRPLLEVKQNKTNQTNKNAWIANNLKVILEYIWYIRSHDCINYKK